MSRPKDPKALIRSGKPRTAEFRVCVDPDLVGEYERAVAQRDAARSAPRDSLGAGAVPPELEERITALLEQIEDKTVVLTFRTLPRPEFRAMRDKYPPRKDEEGRLTHSLDARMGVNADEFFEPLVRASLAAPELDDDTVTVLIDELLTEGQWDDLTTLVWNLNESKIDVPFSPASSPTTPSS